MEIKSISEQLLYSTIRITAGKSVGTAFFFQYEVGSLTVPVIVTNKHVVNNNPGQEVGFVLHTETSDCKSNAISLIYSNGWIFHPNYDLCICYANPIFEQVEKQLNCSVIFRALNESLIFGDEKLKSLTPIEEVVMVGFPLGLWDNYNKLPVFRKGITATAPKIDYQGKAEGLVDMACFNGSSGSPIFIYNQGAYEHEGGLSLGSRLIFLGIQYSSMCLATEGELFEVETGKTIKSRTPILANLGLYIKAKELFYFKDFIKKDLEKQHESA